MKSYKETRNAIKALAVEIGINSITNSSINALVEQGHNVTNIQNAIDYFRFSAATAKYR